METLKELNEKYGDLLKEEMEIEDKAKKDAEIKARQNLEKKRIAGEGGTTKIASCFTGHVWRDCRDNIRNLMETIKQPSKTTQGGYKKPLEDVLATYEEQEEAMLDMLTLITVSCIMDKTLKDYGNCVDVSSVSFYAGRHILDEVDLERFIQQENDKGNDWIRYSMEKGISKRVADSYKRTYARNRMYKKGYQGLKWSRQQMISMGSKLVEAVVYGSGYWVMKPRPTTGGNSLMCLVMTDWLQDAWSFNMDKLVEKAVWYLPMVIPPQHWTSPYDGGYYGASRLGTSLIRLKGHLNTTFVKRYTNLLQHIDLSRVYKALNAMQDTPFVINKYILNVIEQISKNGGDFGGVPRMEPLPILPKLPESATEEQLKEHKKKLVTIYKAETTRKSLALRFLMTLAVAQRFQKYEKIYFPWNIDYRGRCYPIPTALSPQGDDISKSLLLFAEGTPIKEKDVKWLTIHGANLAGHDKITFAERTQWIMNNNANILASAADPLGYTWWYEESKGDYPLEFLAFCN